MWPLEINFKHMKALAFFLAMMTLLLSVTPCCNSENHCVEDVLIECADHCDSEQNTPNPDPPSSPFYACGSCPGFAHLQVLPLSLCYLSFFEQDFNSFYTESLSVSHLHPPNKPPIQI